MCPFLPALGADADADVGIDFDVLFAHRTHTH